jgi:hypothetical protein
MYMYTNRLDNFEHECMYVCMCFAQKFYLANLYLEGLFAQWCVSVFKFLQKNEHEKNNIK